MMTFGRVWANVETHKTADGCNLDPVRGTDSYLAAFFFPCSKSYPLIPALIKGVASQPGMPKPQDCAVLKSSYGSL